MSQLAHQMLSLILMRYLFLDYFFVTGGLGGLKKIPMTLVKSKKAGFMQLSQTMDGSLYRFYKSGQSDANHFSWLENIAGQMSKHFDLVTPVLEVGGGKGFLLNQLKKAGFHNLFNVDPSDDNMDQEDFCVAPPFLNFAHRDLP